MNCVTQAKDLKYRAKTTLCFLFCFGSVWFFPSFLIVNHPVLQKFPIIELFCLVPTTFWPTRQILLLVATLMGNAILACDVKSLPHSSSLLSYPPYTLQNSTKSLTEQLKPFQIG